MLDLLLAHRYYILLPIAIIEGPIVTVLAGFLVSLRLMNPFLVYIIVVAGDWVGDSFYYALGRWSHSLVWSYGHYIGLTHERLDAAHELFSKHHHKTILISKLMQGIGPIGLVAAGNLQISYRKFVQTCLTISSLQSLIFLIIGIFFGGTYRVIGYYLNVYAAIGSALILFTVFILMVKKFKIHIR